MQFKSINPEEFVHVVGPALRTASPAELRNTVAARWSDAQLFQLFELKNQEAIQLLCLTLGMIGDRSCVKVLSQCLRDKEPAIAQMAEFALWSIWFRCGHKNSMAMFNLALEDMEQGRHCEARDKLHLVVEHDQAFAEAYNQCAIAHLMLGELQEALKDCKLAVKHMPEHFGALANMGHTFCQMGEFEQARQAYEKALAIHPGMQEAREALEALNQKFRNAG